MTSEAPIVDVVREGRATHSLPVPPGGLHVGRSPDNDLVLADGGVSRHHCTLWVLDGQLWIRDRGSRNGTFVNDRRLDGAQPIDDRDRLRLGEAVHLRARGAPPVVAPPDPGALQLEDEVSGVRFPLLGGPGTVGGGPGDRVLISGLPPGALAYRAAEADGLRLADGSTWGVGTRRAVGGRPLRLIQTRSALPATLGQESDHAPIHVRVTLDGASGPEAWVHALPDGDAVLVATGNRAVLLYLLARRLHQDREERRPGDEAGWCSDDDLGTGVWGRTWTSQDVNGLHVLIYRVRRALEAEGFGTDGVEKRRKATRLRVARVSLS